MIRIPTITLAQPVHAKGIAEMSRDIIERGLGWSWTRARVLRAIQDRGVNVAVIHEQGELLGFGIMGYGDQKAHLSLLGIRDDQRKRGYGRQLLAWLEKCAVIAGIERIQLEARCDNEIAIAFYASQGYQQTATVPGYYYRQVDAVRLVKVLWTPPPGSPS
jgi:[ribosomal protein S18]-alanine N-acetyltransferase